MNNFDVIIIGGGHAGIEAAYLSSQFGLKVAIITLPGVGLASAPCNPSIGGVGKGQVVREIDVLGGITGKLADLSGIQFRTLNESKGYAVQSTRIQIDKEMYSVYAEILISEIDNIEVIREKATKIENKDNGFIVHGESSTWNTKKIIVTVGTFLNGKMHTGNEQTSGGRSGADLSVSLAEYFKEIDTVSARFKTGTPARLNKESINYEVMEEQKSDITVPSFHCMHEESYRNMQQVSCFLTRTNDKTLKVIRDNKEKSPMFNGQIQGVGARYCPSVEDKAYRYPDKNVHHVFIEPEGINLNTVYPSGISTSLPKEIQEEFLRTIEGLEKCHVEQFGYAVEYDVIDTTQLNYGLELKKIPGIYFAGQVNGTSGYEEAAGQGVIAGINASLSILGREKLILSRVDSYIGVMIEDLISNTRDEPYRLFTARNENRLSVREDNSVTRMAKYREQLGLNTKVDSYNDAYLSTYESLTNTLAKNSLNPGSKFLTSIGFKTDVKVTLSDLLKNTSYEPISTLKNYCSFLGISIEDSVVRNVAIDTKYSGYIAKADVHNQKISGLNLKKISWSKLVKSENISFECKQRIEKIKPETFGQLKLIDGLRPATLAVVAGM
jgi:tRNA uridine 5-carboxymethylaminomethyl modification enzyme